MTHMDCTTERSISYIACDRIHTAKQRPLLLVVEDGLQILTALRCVCDYLEIDIEHVPSEHDLGKLLKESNPIGIVAAFDCRSQDGCDVMMTVARHDRSLPILLVTGNDPGLLGAADAVQEIWRLSSVSKWRSLPAAGEIAEFLCHATHNRNHCAMATSSQGQFV